ncbi:MAG: hypothetical protein AMXMBFR84_35670 [Candidatus Hydrogenedentota bacterium]
MWTFTSLFARNALTLLGASVTTSSAIAMVSLAGLSIVGHAESPYIGILAFMVLPGFFIGGLLMIPVGLFWDRRKRSRQVPSGEGFAISAFPRIDLNRAEIRKALGIVGALTLANLLILSTISYQAVAFMDSEEFCGTVCHTVMEPEYTAYNLSPHSRVECVECHIGPGAPWFVQAKLSGVRQVFAVMFDTFKRPIPTPVHNLRPSQDTCEQCHWPEKFTGDRVRIITEYQEDEANTPLKSVLVMHIGGGNSGAKGIHSWHVDPNKTTEYYTTDEKRLSIDYVRVTDADGTSKGYLKSDSEVDPASIRPEDMRRMDCIDCHNRPTHVYQSPNKAMDLAMQAGRIDPSIPFIKMNGVQALRTVGEALGEAGEVGVAVRKVYEADHADYYAANKDSVEKAIAELETIYSSNVFPEMKVTWGTYPNHIGHVEFDGCFRCHDDNHVTPEGEAIRQDCTICHAVLAMQEESPTIVADLGLE